MQRIPDDTGGVQLRQLPDDVLSHGGEQGDEDYLVLLIPAKEHRICHDTGSVAGTLRDGLRRWRDGAIDVAEGALRAKDRDGLSFPKKKILPCEADGDQAADGADGDDGRRGGAGGDGGGESVGGGRHGAHRGELRCGRGDGI